MDSTVEKARDAVCGAIADAAADKPTKARAEALGTLAHAVAELQYGPTGGVGNSNTRTETHAHHYRDERGAQTGFGGVDG